MNDFFVYLLLGFDHISDIKGYDHLLFIVTLCCIYSITEWRKVVILITAFTIGHSVTLALSAFRIIIFDLKLIEVLIAVTIFITALTNVLLFKKLNSTKTIYHYLLALFFGFIHGMGFSIFFKSLMMENMSLIKPLLAFNVGLEFGQILIVLIFFSIFFVVSNFTKIKQYIWIVVISSFSALISLWMIIQRVKGG